MKHIALIISLKFRAAHISHLVASYRQMEELGFKSYCYIHPEAIPFLPQGIEYITDISEIKNVSIAIFWFPALYNIKNMLKLKLHYKAKIIYVYHEPIESLKTYIKSGNTIWAIIKIFLKYYVSLIFLLLANIIILPSQKAINLYEKHITKWINTNYFYLPLLYSDEINTVPKQERKYFSYIGSISQDHAFDEFINIIYSLYKKKAFPMLHYLIATWQEIPYDKRINEMINAGVLKIEAGKPMTNEEINAHYASTFLVWNAYNRSTQSGVLAKSFMFGTPGLVLKQNLSEFVSNSREVIAIDSNSDYNQIKNAIEFAQNNFVKLSTYARLNFEKNYDYRIHNEEMGNIIKTLNQKN